MSKYLIEMVDGGIINVTDDMICDVHGCPTCNYGGHYTNYVEIELSKNVLNIKFSGMYEWNILTYSDIMKILLLIMMKLKI